MTINNNNIFGAFTLGEVRSGRLTGDWLNKESVANYGWFGGGAPAPSVQVATVDRIDFSNDSISATPRGPLSVARKSLAATGNSNYGWFGGGYTPGPTLYATVDRIDFSNDSATASIRGSLNEKTGFFAATGNSNYGWFGGGFTPTPTTRSTVDRIDFSNDSSTASVRGPLSEAKFGLSATGNSNYGWFGGGATPTVTSIVDRIDFSNDGATASVRGPLNSIKARFAATGNSNYGWFGGADSLAITGTVDRIDFSNDSSTASVRCLLSPAPKYGPGATGNSNYGWFGGGANPGTPIFYATVDRIDFSNDTGTISPRGGTLSAARGYLAATSGVLNIRRQKTGNYGWFGGGTAPGPVRYTTVDRIDFSNDTGTALVRGSLNSSSPSPVGRDSAAATGNSNYGWFGGGFPTPVSTVDRIDFSNDSETASVRGSLTAVKYRHAATGNSNYGWFGGGGNFSTSTATVNRIDFSNDASTASSRGPLFQTRNSLAATGNSNYGWFGGGNIPGAPLGISVSIVDRIDFSNDSATASPRGPLSLARGDLSATGNSNYGWFGGGYLQPGATLYATVDRIDFSNDLATALARSPLSVERQRLAATGNSNYGWFGGGFNPNTARVDRINFSNDLTTASIRGSLSVARQYSAAVSNTPIG